VDFYSDDEHVSNRLYINPKYDSGYVLDEADFGYEGDLPDYVHYTDLVGSMDPEHIAAYPFFKWIEEDKVFVYANYFKRFGAIHPYEEIEFYFIRRYAFRPKTPDRIIYRKVLKALNKIFEGIDGKLEDLLVMRGLAVNRHHPEGVPIRTLSSDDLSQFNKVKNWPDVSAAWIGEEITNNDNENKYDYYVRSYATCLKCKDKLEEIIWAEAIEWVSWHNRTCGLN
jgi:hypothetical protein